MYSPGYRPLTAETDRLPCYGNSNSFKISNLDISTLLPENNQIIIVIVFYVLDIG